MSEAYKKAIDEYQAMIKRQRKEKLDRMKAVIKKEPYLENVNLAERFGCADYVPAQIKKELGINNDWEEELKC